jgi:hypothetical protein
LSRDSVRWPHYTINVIADVELLLLIHKHPIAALVVALVIAVLLHTAFSGAEVLRYTLKIPLTKSEVRFFRLLEKAVPDFYIFPQVGMAAFLEPPPGKERMRYFAKISQKRVDFLLCDEDVKPVLIVELDDWSHDGQEDRDALRDAMPASAGVPTLRVRWVKGLDHNDVRSAVLEMVGRR